MAVIKLFAAIAVLGVLGATAWLAFTLWAEAAVPKLDVVRIEEGETEPVDLGGYAFDQATELLAMAETEKAKEQLEFIVNQFAGSEVSREAGRILGELNLDELLSTDVMEGKMVHEVVRGDTFLGIARRYETTLDCIMHLNNLQRMDRLHPGDELVVMPMNFHIKIDVPRRRLTLLREGRFLKAYPMAEVRTGSGVKGRVRTKIEQKMGLMENRAIPVAHASYRSVSKCLRLAGRGLRIREVAEVNEEDPGNGFFLKPPDIEELALLLRVGNEVEVRFSNE